MTLFDPPEEPGGPADPPTERVRLVIAYDGSNHHGFAPNPGVRTIGGDLIAALTAILRHEVDLVCAGRTDKGVHARAQVVTFDTARGTIEPDRLGRTLEKLCGSHLAVRDVAIVPDDFHARFSAVSRRYRYRILARPDREPLLANQVWHVPEPLDLAAMRLGADAFLGEHDFSSFCRRARRGDGSTASLRRRITDITWTESGDGELHLEITADSFCHQMVRSIVGTLVDVGRGRRRAGEIRQIIAALDRSRAGALAPPQGLSLWQVTYADGWTTP